MIMEEKIILNEISVVENLSHLLLTLPDPCATRLRKDLMIGASKYH